MRLPNFINRAVARRRWIRRLGVFGVPESLWVDYKGLRFYIDPKDWRGPSYHVINWGIESYEEENIRFVFNFLSRSGGGRPGVFMDIGANIGIYSFLVGMKDPQTRIYAFEPEPDSFVCLRKNLEREEFPFAKVCRTGFSDKRGRLTLFRDAANAGGHSVIEEAILEEGNRVTDRVPIEVSTVDEFIAENQISTVDLIKLDVQRHEYEVLQGAQNMLKRIRPVFLMECYFEDLFRSERSLTEPFAGLDYKICDPSNEVFLSLSGSDLTGLEKSGKKFCDLIFYPAEKEDSIAEFSFEQ